MLIDKNLLSAKILKAILGIYLVVVVSLTILHLYIEYRIEKQQAIDSIQFTLESKLEVLKDVVWRFSKDEIDQVSIALLSAKHITGVNLVDEVGFKLTKQGVVPEHDESNAYDVFKKSIIRNGQSIGVISLYCKSSSFFQEVKHTIILTLLSALLKGIVLIFLFYIILKKLVTTRLKDLQSSIINLAENKFEERVTVESEYLDELDQVWQSFIEMKKKINKRDASLKQINKELDLTVQKRTDELKNALDNVEVDLKAKNRFISSVSHELRTPINIISGFSELLLESDLTKEQLEKLKSIHESSSNITELINEIIEYSESSSKINQIASKQLDFISFFEEIKLIHSSNLSMKKLFLKFNKEENVSGFLLTDISKLRQVLCHLVSNAIKFSNDGIIQVNVKLLKEKATTQILKFEVEDQGVGIEKLDTNELFSSFEKENNNLNRTHGGLGLGLSICRNLIDKMGGRIGVESVLGSGSKFWFELEFSKDKLQQPIEKEESKFELEKLNVLVAEDNKLNAKIIKQLLKKGHHNVTIAENGLVAYEIFKEHEFDFVIMDLQMPIMDGVESAKKMLAYKYVPIIACSANYQKGEVEECKNIGMLGFIKKPIKLDQFIHIINNALKTSRDSQLGSKQTS